MSFIKLGGLATAQGNLPEAQRLFGESLRITERLAESDPVNAEWQCNLAVSFHKLGVIHMKREQWAAALPLLERTLSICERLAALSPTQVVLQEDIRENRELVNQVRARMAE